MDRTVAVWKYVAMAPRRRRRILRAGFYFLLCGHVIQLFLRFLIILDFIGTHTIVNKVDAAKGLRKECLLFRIWQNPKLVCFMHRFSP